ncbi:uncharacterized protein N7484_010946 [Penicillium longicatenatum]|uniref:uncharacterized protein n=1 Tax=Penicillium longicatenatum TaxID=1561947 RepID=UPI0025489EED|nr:uncharacterized protein N7484_010946 [Penicillium longicatenatum]KAJ5630846.1 hypothetical protein N7484_010946 [Penicillium longicatenatum]
MADIVGNRYKEVMKELNAAGKFADMVTRHDGLGGPGVFLRLLPFPPLGIRPHFSFCHEHLQWTKQCLPFHEGIHWARQPAQTQIEFDEFET